MKFDNLREAKTGSVVEVNVDKLKEAYLQYCIKVQLWAEAAAKKTIELLESKH